VFRNSKHVPYLDTINAETGSVELIFMYVCMYIFMYVCMYMYVVMCVCICICM